MSPLSPSPPTVLVRCLVAGVLAAGLTACSSDSGSGTPSDPTTQAAQSTAAPSTGETPANAQTKAACTKVTGIITVSSKTAITTLSKALQARDHTQIAQAYTQVKTTYRGAATQLRTVATTVTDPTLKKQIQNAAAYFERAASNPQAMSGGSDNSLSVLSKTCT